MEQLCRFCTRCVAQSDEYAWCEHKQKMVRRYAKNKRCTGFEFCRIDAFYAFRGLEVTDPKALYQPKPEPDLNNVELIEWVFE